MNSMTVVGNLTDTPQVTTHQRKDGTGSFRVARFGLGTNRRIKVGDKWEDRQTGRILVVINDLYGPENVAKSLKKGDRVMVTGRLETRSYESNGETRYITELLAEEIGPTLRWHTVEGITKSVPSKETPAAQVPSLADYIKGEAAKIDQMVADGLLTKTAGNKAKASLGETYVKALGAGDPTGVGQTLQEAVQPEGEQEQEEGGESSSSPDPDDAPF